jgi:hypothetical protein
MRLPNGEVLMHGSQPYDPVKAHEYYEKHKKLKGRDKKVGELPAKGAPGGLGKPATATKKADPAAKAAARQAAVERVNSIKAKLTELNGRLKRALAKAESGGKKSGHTTAAEKSEAARDSKKYRDTHKQELKNKARRSSDDKKSSRKPSDDNDAVVESLKAQISEVKGRLTAAVEKLRSLN